MFSLSLSAQDIGLSSIYIGEERLNWGDILAVVCSGDRDGDDLNANIGYYLSRDTVLDSSDSLLFTSSRVGTGSWISSYLIGCNTSFYGWYYIIGYLDHDNEIAESNEENNILVTGSFFIDVQWDCGVELELEKENPWSDPEDLNNFGFDATLKVKSHISYRYESIDAFTFFLSEDNSFDDDDIVLYVDPEPIDIPTKLDSGVSYYTNVKLTNWSDIIPDGFYYLGVMMHGPYAHATNGNVNYFGYYFDFDNLEEDPNGRIKIGDPVSTVEINKSAEKVLLDHFNLLGQPVSVLKPYETYIRKFSDGTFDKIVYSK